MASASFELFKEFLDSKGFNYASHIDNDGDGVVDFPYDGKVVKCFRQAGNGYGYIDFHNKSLQNYLLMICCHFS